jgi:hypothetical protein
MFGVDIHNPYTPNDVSAHTTEVRIDVPDVASPEVITKKILSATALRKVFAVDNYFSVRQNLIYCSYRSRGREYKQPPILIAKNVNGPRITSHKNGSRLCCANQFRASVKS